MYNSENMIVNVPRLKNFILCRKKVLIFTVILNCFPNHFFKSKPRVISSYIKVFMIRNHWQNIRPSSTEPDTETESSSEIEAELKYSHVTK